MLRNKKIIEPSNGPTKRKNIPGAMLQLQIVHYHLVASAVACEIVFSYPTSSINIKTKLT